MKFSICIPNYNYGQYIGDTIRSVLEQDFNDFEIIISDNNSTDNSWKIIEDYALKDNRIVVHQNKVNIGFSGNLDLVSSHASGDYQILVSSDDLMNKGALQFYDKFLSEFGCNQNIVLSSTCIRINELNEKIGLDGPKSKIWFDSDIDTELSKRFNFKIYKVDALEMLKRCLNTFYGPFNFVSTCYSSIDYDKLGGYGGSRLYNPDKWLHWRLLSNVDYAYFIDFPFFSYRWHSNNQFSLQLESGNLKYLLDEYRASFELDNIILNKVKMNTRDIQESFVYNVIQKYTYTHIKNNQLTMAKRTFLFGWACYPEIMRSNKNNIYFSFLLKLRKLGVLIAKYLKY